ncbi:uncharacterized mitochondrial protein-like protein [Tanacetum coccineum]
MIKNKARLVAQGYIQEEGIDCDEVFAPVTRIEAIRLFLAYALFKDFVVYQMESQDKYVTEILKKFGFTDVKTASTPMETQKLLLKDKDGEEVDVHLYRSMISLLMYLTSSRLDIMFAVYLKGQPKLGLCYPKDSPFDLVAYTDSDYARASLDRKSTTGRCQFLGMMLVILNTAKLMLLVILNIAGIINIVKINRIGVNAGDSKLMLLGINLLLLEKVNAARHKLTTAGES